MAKRKRKQKVYSNWNSFNRPHENKRDKEYWRTISGYEPAYQVKVSDRGRVVIVPEFKTDEDGREFVTLCGRDVPVDVLVARAFIPNPSQSDVPFHKNGDMSDSRVINLKWVPAAEDPDIPGRISSSLSMLTYILRPNLLADRDKEFTKFYTYLDYLWKSGQLPRENEQMIMEAYDNHRKRVTEDWIQSNMDRESVRKRQSSVLQNQDTSLNGKVTNGTPAQAVNPVISDNSSTVNTDSILNPLSIDYSDLGIVTTPDIPHPFMNIPDELLAAALIDLYDRAFNELTGKNESWVKPVPISQALPELIGNAIRRVANQGTEKTNTWFMSRNLMETKVRSRANPENEYVRFGDSKVQLGASLTHPYRLNMLPQLPPLEDKSNKVPRTSHLQSVLKRMQKDGTVPDWAFDSLLEALTPEIWSLLGFTDSSGNPVDRPDDGYSLRERLAAICSDRLSREKTDAEIKKNPGMTKADMSDFVRRDNQVPVQEKEETKKEAKKPVHNDYWSTGLDSAVVKEVRKPAESVISFGSSAEKSTFTEKSEKSEKTGSLSQFPNLDSVTYDRSRVKTPESPDIYPRDEFHAYNDPNWEPRRDDQGNRVHPRRKRVFTLDEIKLKKLRKDINTLPEFDILGRPLYDCNMVPLEYDDSLEVPVAPAKGYPMKAGYLLQRNEQKYMQSRKLAKWLNDRESLEKTGKLSDGSGVSPLYDPERDITRGIVNTRVGLEESSYYNEAGQKVYHNVRYGQRYDPDVHTLYIPELYEFPEMFNTQLQKELYLADYVAYLQRHNPEIGNPDILRKYYETAKAARRVMSVVPNSLKQNIFKSGAGVAVRGWLPDGECVVFPSMKSASAATGCTVANIGQCVKGERPHAYGIRWELVDIGDMDTMINRYIKKVMDVCEEGDLQIDWDEYISPEARKRMDVKLDCERHRFDNRRHLKYRWGLEHGFGEDFERYEPYSQTERPGKFEEPEDPMYEGEGSDVMPVPEVEFEADEIPEEDILYEEIRELDEEIEARKARLENPLNSLLDEMLGDDSEE